MPRGAVGNVTGRADAGDFVSRFYLPKGVEGDTAKRRI